MSSDFNYNFCFVVEEWFSSLGILQNLDVSESTLKHKYMEKNLGSIRGRQATVDAPIGNEHYPTIRRLRTHSDWLRKLSQRTLIGYENYQKIRSSQTGIEKSYGRTYLFPQMMALVATPLKRQVATKIWTSGHGEKHVCRILNNFFAFE